MKKLSINDLAVRFFGFEFDGGWAEDDPISCTPEEDAVMVVTGADGTATVSYLQNKTWDVKIRVMENSNMHRRIGLVYSSQQAGAQVSGSSMIRRTTSGETLQSSNVVISRPPNFDVGKSAKVREWSFKFCESNYVAGGV